MITDDDSHLRKLNNDLYTSDVILPTQRRVLHAKKFDAPEDWAESNANQKSSFMPTNNKPKTPSSFFKKLFFGSLGILAIAVVVLLISFATGGNTISSKNVDITITAKTFVDGGEDLPVDITIVNKNKSALELATLTLTYPEGNAQNPNAVATISRDVGTIAAGGTHDESFDITLYGQENTVENLGASLQFDTTGSNAVYTTDQTFAVTIRTSPVLLTLAAPASAIPNQQIPLTFTIVGNGTATLSNTALVVAYPDGFTFASATPPPSFQNNVFYLGDLPPGANRTITINGSFSGSLNSSQTIQASIGAQNASNQAVLDTVYNDVAQVIPLSQSFLAAQLEINNATTPTIAINQGDTIDASISYSNTTSSPITNAEIDVDLSGSAYDPASVQPQNGYFNSSANEIQWTSQQVPALATLAPGASGQFTFSLVPKDLSGVSVSNPSIILSANVLGYGSDGVKQSATSVDTKTVLINSDLNLLASTLHYSGGIKNTGPMPPSVNKETTYTLVWQITNSRNRVTGVTVSTTLPTNVDFKNVIVPSSQSANVTYNSVSRIVQWNVGDVDAATGTSPTTQTVSMQVGITPSSQQESSAPDLTGPITVSGTDSFTNQTISVTHRADTTELLNDTSSVGGDGQVQ